MDAVNPKSNALSPAQVAKLEAEMKSAFQEGRFEEVKKKAEALLAADPKSRLAVRMLEKAKEAEVVAAKKANAEKISVLEQKMDQAFKVGNLASMTQLAEEVKKLDPANKKALKIEAMIASARVSLDAEMAKEKLRKLMAELAFFVNKADWGGVADKANEMLAIDGNSSAAMAALEKAAKAKSVAVSTLLKVARPIPVEKPGFFARLFGHKEAGAKAPDNSKSVVAKSMPVKEVPKVVAPIAAAPAPLKTVVVPMPVKEVPKVVAPIVAQAPAKSVSAQVPVAAQVKKPEVAKAPGLFARLFGHGAEKKEIVAKPVVAAPALKVVAKPEVTVPAKAVSVAVPMKLEEKKVTAPVPPVVVAKPIVSPLSVSAPIPVSHEVAKVPVATPAPAIAAMPMPTPAVVPVVAPAITPPMPVAVNPIITPTIKPPMPVATVPSVVPQAPKPVQAQLKVEQKAVVKPESGALEKGNIFTSLFGKKEEMEPEKKSASVLETIVAKTAPAKQEVKTKHVDEGTGEKFLGFANAFLQFAVAFIVVSGGFLYVENLDTDNRVLSIVKAKNNAIQLHEAATKLDAKKEEERKLNLEIKKFQGGYEDEHRESIKKIVADRMDWTELLKKLNEVTESVYEKNALSQYVQYNNYSYNAKTGQLTVSATLSDPLGKNLTKLAEIEEAFRFYPKDPGNPKDERKPYFYGVTEFKSFAKSFNAATGRYQSQFSLTLFTKDQGKKK